MIPNSARLSPWHAILLVVTLASGSAYALYNTYQVFIPYPDCINGALIYFDVQRDGLEAIRYWVLPADNFLLVLHSIYQVWFPIFGTSVASIVIFSYGVFLLCVVLSALIIEKIAADQRQAAWSAILLFAAPMNLINANQSHPLGHNSTMVYVLLASLIVIGFMASHRRDAWGIGILVFVTAICTFSDPWFDAAFTIPALLSLAVLAFWSRTRTPELKQTAWLITVSLIVGLACGRGIYEIMAHYGFVPRRSTSFAFADTVRQILARFGFMPGKSTPVAFVDLISANLRSLLQVLPTLFNYGSERPQGPLDWAFIGFGLGLAGIVCRHAVPVWRRIGMPGKFMLLFALLSSASMALAFLVTRYASFNTGLAAARYVLNVYYMAFVAGIIIVGAVWARLGWQKFVVIGWLGLFAVPGLLAGWRTFEHVGLEHPNLRVHQDLVATLQKEGLAEGFAPYVSGAIGANSLTYLGKNELAVRPVEVVGGRLRPFSANVYQRWYTEGKSANFLVVHRSDESAYHAAALASFGAPHRTIRSGDYVIWVWPDNLMPLLTGA